MTTQEIDTGRWYARDADAVAERLGTDLGAGLSAEQVAERLGRYGPNALPTEEPTPGWRRFLDEYRSYMQMILVGAAVVSLAIKEWSTAVVLVAITLLNAVVGLRQQGKAESAMNALKSMMKETARVRRGGAEAEIPAEELVPGDVVLLAAGDQVPADGRLIAASSLQIDESALTGESLPAGKDRRDPAGRGAGPRRPDEHGVHAYAGDPRQRCDDRDRHGERHAGRPHRRHAGCHRERGDAAHQADEHADAVDRGCGRA